MTDIIAALAVIAAIAGAVTYIVRSKKRGTRCIGCPYSDSCGKRGNCTEKKQ